MTVPPRPSRAVLLGVEPDGAGRHPAAWRLPGAEPAALFGPDRAVALARLADAADLDLLVVPDSFRLQGAVGPGPVDEVRGRLDAVALAARTAPTTRRVGVAPVVTTTHTEPFHTSKALATLDIVSGGRAGWQIGVSDSAAEADAFGRKGVEPDGELWAEAAEAAAVVRLLWDSWEDDAVVRDTATGRYVDRDKLHHVDFRGERFSVKGPSITPRPPQGQ
ncbi:LLM class flavin-dependent oxidoreductase, partial [Kineococcus glutinatus]|uniref:LLM class flavin-dependent oxidoreductase n=1 Tax=Kineococcus glutinatus TaxID=1070872 RepID=UPI0031EFBED8